MLKRKDNYGNDQRDSDGVEKEKLQEKEVEKRAERLRCE